MFAQIGFNAKYELYGLIEQLQILKYLHGEGFLPEIAINRHYNSEHEDFVFNVFKLVFDDAQWDYLDFISACHKYGIQTNLDTDVNEEHDPYDDADDDIPTIIEIMLKSKILMEYCDTCSEKGISIETFMDSIDNLIAYSEYDQSYISLWDADFKCIVLLVSNYSFFDKYFVERLVMMLKNTEEKLKEWRA